MITSKRSQGLIDWAITFATTAHTGQVRKYTGEPYITHPLAVAELVASVTEDAEAITAAILHDTVEDTGVTLEEIARAGFGWQIARLVEQLTDVSKPEDGNRAARKAIDLAHTAKASPKAQTVKLADLIHNTESIVARDPSFAVVYMKEKQRLLAVLGQGDRTLYAKAVNLVKDYYA